MMRFIKLLAYENKWKDYKSLPISKRRKTNPPREDLELNTLVEILNSERFITCHSYVQSEINMLIYVWIQWILPLTHLLIF